MPKLWKREGKTYRIRLHEEDLQVLERLIQEEIIKQGANGSYKLLLLRRKLYNVRAQSKVRKRISEECGFTCSACGTEYPRKMPKYNSIVNSKPYCDNCWEPIFMKDHDGMTSQEWKTLDLGARFGFLTSIKKEKKE